MPFPHRGPNITTPDPAAMRQAEAAAADLTAGLAAARDAERAYAVALTDPAHAAARAEVDALREANARLASVADTARRAVDRLAAVQAGTFLSGYRAELKAKEQLARAGRDERALALRADRQQFRATDPAGRARSDLSFSRGRERFDQEKERAALTARLRLSDGSENRDAAGRRAVEQMREQVAGRQQVADLGARLGDSPAAVQAAARQRLAIDRMREQVATRIAAAERQARREMLGDGRAVAAYRERLAAAKDVARLAREDRAAELTAKYGRTGGRVVGAAEGKPGRLAAAGAAAVTGLAAKGFSGTVEMERFNLQLTFVSRQFAGVMKPALDTATGGLARLNRAMSRMTDTQKDAAMYATLAVGGAAAANGIGKRLFGVGLAEAGGAAAGRLGLGGAAAAGVSPLANFGATAGGMAAGSAAGRFAGGRGLLARGAAAAPRFGVIGAGVATAVAATGALNDDARFKSLGDQYRGTGIDLDKKSDAELKAMADYDRSQETHLSGAWKRGERLWQNLGMGVNSMMHSTTGYSVLDPNEKIDRAGRFSAVVDEELDRRKAQKASRSVTPAEGGFDSLGSSFDRLAVRSDTLGVGMGNQEVSQAVKDIRDLIRLQDEDRRKPPEAPDKKPTGG